MADAGSGDPVKNLEPRKCEFVKEEHVKHIMTASKQEMYSGKWIGLNRITYTDPTGTERTWEAMRRTTRQSNAEADAVVSIPILKRLLHYDCVILVKQYRPPVHGYTLEFPAGLIDPNETSEQCAVRELKEETGYSGVPKHKSPAIGSNPTTSSSTEQMVTIEIDGNLPENQNPKPQLEAGEFIEVFIVPLDDMLNRLNEFTREGLMVYASVYSYAIAMEQTKSAMTKQIAS